MSADRPRRFAWWAYWLALAVILVFALWPVGSVMLASSIAEANGCALDEGSIHPCIVNGEDMGKTVYALAMLGWFMIGTIPLGGAALLIWLATLIIHRLTWGRSMLGGARHD